MINNNNNDKHYSKGYKPNVCIADYTIKYFPTKYKQKLLGTDKEKAYASKFVKSIHVLKESILLNDDSQFVNNDLKLSHLRRVLGRRNIKYSKDNTYLLRNLKIHSHSKATYTVHNKD
tara:strand:- start:1024 stop:1377 length:354 start_codon:yes stop_codon:yes gene_type:complete